MKTTDNTWNHLEHGLPLTSNEQADGGWKNDAAGSLARNALMLATISIAAAFLMPVAIPVILSVIAMILALLSRGRHHRIGRTARRAVITALAGIVVNIAVIASMARTITNAVKDPFTHARLNQSVQNLYGQNFDDMIRTFDQNYGTDLESALGIGAARE